MSHLPQNDLSLRFELTGGFIKNAILSALSIAVSRDGEHPVVCQKDLLQGANLQLRGRLRMKVKKWWLPFFYSPWNFTTLETHPNALKSCCMVRGRQTCMCMHASSLCAYKWISIEASYLLISAQTPPLKSSCPWIVTAPIRALK